MVNNNDSVDDNEVLYRRIPASWRFNQPLYVPRDNGTIKISSQAFHSRDFRISVDRAKLRENDPRKALEHEDDRVVSLVARDIRDIVGLVRKADGGEAVQFRIDVEPIPLTNNDAHAEIYAIPGFAYDSRRVFHKLCERLAQLAEKRWEILPDDI